MEVTDLVLVLQNLIEKKNFCGWEMMGYVHLLIMYTIIVLFHKLKSENNFAYKLLFIIKILKNYIHL